MSSPILPVQGPEPPANAGSLIVAGAGKSVTSPPTTAAGEPSVYVDTFPTSPPPEVLDQVTAAGQVYEQLSSQGHALHFSTDDQSGETQIEVRDHSGNTLRTLSASEAIEIAAGRPLD